MKKTTRELVQQLLNSTTVSSLDDVLKELCDRLHDNQKTLKEYEDKRDSLESIASGEDVEFEQKIWELKRENRIYEKSIGEAEEKRDQLYSDEILEKVKKNIRNAEELCEYAAIRISNEYPSLMKSILNLLILEEKAVKQKELALQEAGQLGIRQKISLPMQRLVPEGAMFMNLFKCLVLHDIKKNQRVWPIDDRRNGQYSDLFHGLEEKTDKILKRRGLLPVPINALNGSLTPDEKNELAALAQKDWDSSPAIQQAHSGNFKSYLGEIIRHEEQLRNTARDRARKQQHEIREQNEGEE